jgi:O-antigen ligase
MNRSSYKLTPDGIVLIIAVLLANLRASIFIHLDPDTSVILGPAWIEIGLWFFALIAVVYSIARNNQVPEYWLMIRRNWLVALFILLASVSIFWSVDPAATAFRTLELLCATLIAVYIGMRYRISQLMELLFWFGAIILILSTALAFAVPKTGTMYWPPFDGAWRGLFWHRNHLSSITALLSVVFLCRAILAFEEKDGRGILDVFFYFVSLVVLFFAKSATGHILFLSLNFLVLCIWVWLKVRQNLRAPHYYLILGIFGAGAVWIFSNLDVVFGLFHRNTTLTGRVGLWENLLNHLVARRPWWGHGFGAVWTVDSFREEIRQYAGWTAQPLIADNGFLDILLHLGVVGLVLLFAILVLVAVQSFRYAFSGKRLEDFFPLFFLCYVLIANIPFSMIAETEVFIWFLLVTVLVMTTPSWSLKNE